MLKRARNILEFVIQPRNWLTLILFIGTIASIVTDKGTDARTFTSGWLIASLVAYIPALFSSSWDNRCSELVKADRSLAYCEGWRRCLASLETYKQTRSGAGDSESFNFAVDDSFRDGLAYVEKGKHMSIL